jgi:hypothetical protein
MMEHQMGCIRHRHSQWAVIGALTLAQGLAACGYTLKKTDDTLLRQQGVYTLYVEPLGNDSYKAGGDNLVYNELLRSLSAQSGVRIVQRLEDADAVLSGEVESASYRAGGTTKAEKLFPYHLNSDLVTKNEDLDLARIAVATQYRATLATQFVLRKRAPGGGKGQELWAGSFTRSLSFPATNQLGIYGNTSPLINESEFERALREIARNMMRDLNESMSSRF